MAPVHRALLHDQADEKFDADHSSKCYVEPGELDEVGNVPVRLGVVVVGPAKTCYVICPFFVLMY